MINFHTEVIRHMLEVVDAKEISILLKQPSHWVRFNEWCDSKDAADLLNKSSDDVETVCINKDENMYCIAMSMTTLESLVKELTEAYEDQELERFVRLN